MRLIKALYEAYQEEFDLNLKEGLIKSYPIDKTVGFIKRKFPNWFYKYDNTKSEEHFIQIVINHISEKEYKQLSSLLLTTGYFISFIKFDLISGLIHSDKFSDELIKYLIDNEDVNTIIFLIEPKYDTKIDDIPDKLYHVTPLTHWDKIKRIGLVPKSRSKKTYHPERVYLTKDEESAKRLISMFYKIDNTENEWCLLEINTHLIPSYFRLYQDSNYKKYGYYTLNTIPSHSIKKIEDIQI